MTLDSLISLAFYASALGFLVATVITALAAKKVGKSGLGTVLSYLLIGTGIFFVITVFQTLGGGFFRISNESMDIWWHLMFYLAMLSYFFGFKALTRLGADETKKSGMKIWAAFCVIALILIFKIPNAVDGIVMSYNTSVFSSFGLHHFLAFGIAALVAGYLFSAKKNLGQIGKAIANPMLIAVLAFAVQHFWELLNESWKVITVTPEVGEGVEKIFLVIAAICVTVAALRLKRLAKAS